MPSSVGLTVSHGSSSAAPVLEYVCLFTHDLKRKQKRWQDGRLKFHAFNKRIMVYDERGNFIGDTHWREDYDFGDGEEVELERGGIIVQAAECVASHSQDLSELIDKRAQEKFQRQSIAAARQSRLGPSRNGGIPPQAATTHPQVRHTPLSSLLGTPTGHHGRALVPSESPFEDRQMSAALQTPGPQEESPRPTKRRRRDPSPPSKSGYAQSLFGAALTLSGGPMSSAPVQHRPRHLRLHQPACLPISSSDMSDQNDYHDDSIKVSVSSKTSRSREKAPLSERQPTNVNIPTIQSDVLIGKDTTAKRNMPSLPCQSKPQAARTSVQHDEAFLSDLKPASAQSPTADGHENRLQDVDITKSLGKKHKTTNYENPGRSHLSTKTSRPSSAKHPRVRAERNEPIASVTNSNPVSLNLEPPEQRISTREIVEVQKTPIVCNVAVSGPETSTVEKPTIREPRIELRMAPSKRRGLLMLSERSNKKAARPSRSANCGGDRGHSHSTETAIGENSSSVGRKTQTSTTGIEASRPTLEVMGRQAYIPEAQTHNVISSTNDESVTHCCVNGTYVAMDSSIQAQRSNHSTCAGSSICKTRTTHHEFERHENQQASTGTRNQTTHQEEDIRNSTRAEPSAKDIDETSAIMRRTCGEPGQRKKNIETFSTHAWVNRSDKGKVGGTHDAHVLVSSPENTNPPAMETFDEEYLDEIFKNRPENVPPPRLAQLSRKSVRSREVIGLYYEEEDNGLSFQPRLGAPPVAEEDSFCNIRKTTAALTRSCSTKESLNDSVRTDGKRVMGTIPTSRAEPTKPAESKHPRQAHSTEHDRLVHPTSGTFDKFHTSEIEALSSAEETRPSRGSRTLEHAAHSPIATRREIMGLSPGDLDGAASDSKLMSNSSRVSLNRERCKSNMKDSRALNARDMSPPRQVAPRLGLAMPSNNHVPEDDVQEQAASTTISNQKPVKRIVNPATRGKKAAKPSDAAGQTPKSILPPDDQSLIRTASKLVKPPSNPMPGFSKANGGPWSREAHDLFEYKRPD